MTEDQADQIIDFLYGMARPPDEQETRRSWKMYLTNLDPDLASKAAIKGAQSWERFPSWPAFYGEYRALDSKVRPHKVSCSTCDDDRMVLVETRPEGSGEMGGYAPCPDCNAKANTSFRRYDGTMVETMDPAQVRERMVR